MKPINQIFPLLSESRKIVITFHQKPDADALGSALALYHFLLQFHHEVTVISPTNWADFLNWMPGVENVLEYEQESEASEKAMNEAKWLFCLDFNTLSRTKNMESALAGMQCTKILIDHHRQPQEEVFDYGISDTEKSSTAEMIYDFIVESGHRDKINAPAAQCLYAGVMTDTGSFRFRSTTASVHRMVADLKDGGLEHSMIHENLFDNYLESRFRFIGHTLMKRLEVFYEYNAALISIQQKDLIRFNVKTGDTEGLVNYPLSIKGIRLAAIIIDRGDERKSSFRSKCGFDVNSFARKYFNGGGHFNAAGGHNSEPLDEVKAKFMQALEENKELLNN